MCLSGSFLGCLCVCVGLCLSVCLSVFCVDLLLLEEAHSRHVLEHPGLVDAELAPAQVVVEAVRVLAEGPHIAPSEAVLPVEES